MPVKVGQPFAASGTNVPVSGAPIEREDVIAALEARKELGQTYEPEVVDAFLDRVEHAIAARVEAERQLAAPPAEVPQVRSTTRPDWSALALAIPSLVVGAAATTAIAGPAGGLYGWHALVAVVVEWSAIAAINVAYIRRRR